MIPETTHEAGRAPKGHLGISRLPQCHCMALCGVEGAAGGARLVPPPSHILGPRQTYAHWPWALPLCVLQGPGDLPALASGSHGFCRAGVLLWHAQSDVGGRGGWWPPRWRAGPELRPLPPAAIEDDVLRYQFVKKKGYVRLHTNKGDLNLELHCDLVRGPRGCGDPGPRDPCGRAV